MDDTPCTATEIKKRLEASYSDSWLLGNSGPDLLFYYLGLEYVGDYV